MLFNNIYIFLFHLSLFVWCNANIKKLIMKHKEDSKCYKKIDYYYYYFIPYIPASLFVQFKHSQELIFLL